MEEEQADEEHRKQTFSNGTALLALPQRFVCDIAIALTTLSHIES